MDPMTDLPPMTTHLADHVADPPPTLPTNQTHPPYPEMITAAITALKDKDGSSRQAIAKYIEKEYTNLPPTHSMLLTQYLKRLKNQGQLIMVKYSYMLPPRSGQFQPPTSTGYHPTFDFSESDVNASTAGLNLENSSKRKPGRPPKLRPYSGLDVQSQMPNVQAYEADVHVHDPPYQPQFQYDVGVGQDLPVNYGSGSDFQGNSVGGSEPLFASLGLSDDGVGVAAPSPPPTENSTAKRGRGRPPKVVGGGGGGSGGEIQGIRTGSGRRVRKPLKMSMMMMGGNVGRVKSSRGRKRIGFGAVTVPLSGNVLRSRGRPKRVGRPNKFVNGGESGLGSRYGWPSISKVGPGTAVLVTDPNQLVVYQELKNKYELLQSKVKQVTSVIKSWIDPDYGNEALGALNELESLVAPDTNGPSHVQTQEPPPFPQL